MPSKKNKIKKSKKPAQPTSTVYDDNGINLKECQSLSEYLDARSRCVETHLESHLPAAWKYEKSCQPPFTPNRNTIERNVDFRIERLLRASDDARSERRRVLNHLGLPAANYGYPNSDAETDIPRKSNLDKIRLRQAELERETERIRAKVFKYLNTKQKLEVHTDPGYTPDLEDELLFGRPPESIQDILHYDTDKELIDRKIATRIKNDKTIGSLCYDPKLRAYSWKLERL